MLLTSCSSSSNAPGDSDYSLADELAYLHRSSDTPDSIVIQATDFRRVAEILDIPRFDDDASAREVAEWLASVSAPFQDEPSLAAILPNSFEWGARLSSLDTIDEVLGYSLRDVERFVEKTTLPSASLVAQGTFDESAVTDALREALTHSVPGTAQ